jgi:hypothetical protein
VWEVRASGRATAEQHPEAIARGSFNTVVSCAALLAYIYDCYQACHDIATTTRAVDDCLMARETVSSQ